MLRYLLILILLIVLLCLWIAWGDWAGPSFAAGSRENPSPRASRSSLVFRPL